MIKTIVTGFHEGKISEMGKRIQIEHSDISNKIVTSFVDNERIYPSYERHVNFIYFFNNNNENIAYYVEGSLVILEKGRAFHKYDSMIESIW